MVRKPGNSKKEKKDIEENVADDNKLVDDALVAKDSEAAANLAEVDVEDISAQIEAATKQQPPLSPTKGKKSASGKKSKGSSTKGSDEAAAALAAAAVAVADSEQQQQQQPNVEGEEPNAEEGSTAPPSKKSRGDSGSGGVRRPSIANLLSATEEERMQAAARPYIAAGFPPYYGYGPVPFPPNEALLQQAAEGANGGKDGEDSTKDGSVAGDAGKDAGAGVPGQFAPYPIYYNGYPYYYLPGQQGVTGGTPPAVGGQQPPGSAANASNAAAAAAAAVAGFPVYATGPGGKVVFPNYPGRPGGGSPGGPGFPADGIALAQYGFYDPSQHGEDFASSISRKPKRVVKRKRKADADGEGDGEGEGEGSGSTTTRTNGRPVPGVTSSERTFACPYENCHWSFTRLSDQRRHLRSHQKPTFHCPYWQTDPTCHRNGGAFNRSDVLKRHLRLVHFVQFKQSDSGWCRSCQKMFPSPKHFVEHCERCAQSIRPTEWKVDTGRVIVQNGPKGRSVTITDAILGPKEPTLLSMADVDNELKAKQEGDIDADSAEAAVAAVAAAAAEQAGEIVDNTDTSSAAAAVAAVAAAEQQQHVPTTASTSGRRGRGVGSNRGTLSQAIQAGHHAGATK